MDEPNKRYPHVFGVVRVDPGCSSVRDSVSGTKAFRTRDEAEAECERLEAVNGAKACAYVVVYLRLVEQA